MFESKRSLSIFLGFKLIFWAVVLEKIREYKRKTTTRKYLLTIVWASFLDSGVTIFLSRKIRRIRYWNILWHFCLQHRNMGILNWQTMILDDYLVDDSYWENTKLELSKEVEWITQSELYKKVKRNDGSGNDIILSVPVSAVLETIKSFFILGHS